MSAPNYIGQADIEATQQRIRAYLDSVPPGFVERVILKQPPTEEDVEFRRKQAEYNNRIWLEEA